MGLVLRFGHLDDISNDSRFSFVIVKSAGFLACVALWAAGKLLETPTRAGGRAITKPSGFIDIFSKKLEICGLASCAKFS